MASSRKRRLKLRAGKTEQPIPGKKTHIPAVRDERKLITPEASIHHTRLYSKIYICWEEEDGSQQTMAYKYKTQQDLDQNIAKIKALKDIFPRLSIKKSLIDYLKTLRPAQYHDCSLLTD
jgi:hypothetical protein